MPSGSVLKWSGEHTLNYANAKLSFQQELSYMLHEKKLKTRVLEKKQDIDNVMNDIKQNHSHYWEYFKEKCHIVNQNGKDILCQIYNTTDVVETQYTVNGKPFRIPNIKQILCIDDLFDVLSELHMCKPHLDQVGILDHFSNCTIHAVIINLFWKSCETCCKVLKIIDSHKLIGEMTVISLNLNDNEFTDIFMYIERNTNFVLLRPLQSISSEELAYELLTILADFGSPASFNINILRSLFKNEILNTLQLLKPPFRICNMSANSPTSKIDILASKAKALLINWMEKTQSTNWAIGAHIVQWIMNSNKVVDTYIRSKVVKGPIHSPYHAVFGILPHTDIVKINNNHQFDPTNNKEKHVDCSQCNQPVYKIFKCHFCQKFCHFSCCVRYIEQVALTPTFINKCILCDNGAMSMDEEVILGT